VFISKTEKEEMQRSITYLLGEFSKLWSDYLVLKAKVKVLEEKNLPKLPKPTEEELKEELKKAQKRAYGKAYYQRKKEREQVLNVGS
jgi:dsDNA-specific endonuclease/ATPase MutS2